MNHQPFVINCGPAHVEYREERYAVMCRACGRGRPHHLFATADRTEAEAVRDAHATDYIVTGEGT